MKFKKALQKLVDKNHTQKNDNIELHQIRNDMFDVIHEIDSMLEQNRKAFAEEMDRRGFYDMLEKKYRPDNQI